MARVVDARRWRAPPSAAACWRAPCARRCAGRSRRSGPRRGRTAASTASVERAPRQRIEHLEPREIERREGRIEQPAEVAHGGDAELSRVAAANGGSISATRSRTVLAMVRPAPTCTRATSRTRRTAAADRRACTGGERGAGCRGAGRHGLGSQTRRRDERRRCAAGCGCRERRPAISRRSPPSAAMPRAVREHAPVGIVEQHRRRR